jgi:circadian clock protein KaiC
MSTLPDERRSSGIRGLDTVLRGGFLPQRSYLVSGAPGTGKTILGLHFLHTGLRLDEQPLLITFSEPATSLERNLQNLGFSFDRIKVLDLTPPVELFSDAEQSYDLLSPAETERQPVLRRIAETVDELAPVRVFVDGLNGLRYYAADRDDFLRSVQAFLQFITGRGATILVTAEPTPDPTVGHSSEDLEHLVDGSLTLTFTQKTRKVSVSKFRGSGFSGGAHTLRIGDEGISVFPTLTARRDLPERRTVHIPFSIESLDQKLHGGIEPGTATLLTGPPGVGKTTLGLQFMRSAALQGERGVVYSFDEEPALMELRCRAVGLDLSELQRDGRLMIEKVEPLEYSAEEFADWVKHAVEEGGARCVMVDSLSGYSLSIADDRPIPSLHALSKYLTSAGVSLIIAEEMSAITGDFRPTESRISYLSDNIIFLRYIERFNETSGSVELHKILGVLKKRLSDFDKGLHAFDITPEGIRVGGKPLGSRSLLGGPHPLSEGP